MVDVVRIELPSPASGEVVAVNVYAMPMGPVGVRWDSDKGGPSFAFPLRTATQTQFLTSTELAMLMVPEIRRIEILLDSIPADERKKVRLHMLKAGAPVYTHQAVLLGIDPDLSAARFFIHRSGEGAVPLDRLESVWREGDGSWSGNGSAA